MRKSTTKRWRVLGVAAVLVASSAIAVGAWTAQAEDLPACPEVWAHGGYPTGADPWKRDQVRQPNNPEALRDMKSKGVSGVEVDLQLTRNGHKAVMWHNGTTRALTGSKASVGDLWWDTGANKLNGRTIEVGPYKGERVYSLRQFLDAADKIGIVPMIELKSSTAQWLLNKDGDIKEEAWSEVLDPVAERLGDQEILMYTHDKSLKPVLKDRVHDAKLDDVLKASERRPVWEDTVKWEEPPPSAKGNYESWAAALRKEPMRMATSWPVELRSWLKGKCA